MPAIISDGKLQLIADGTGYQAARKTLAPAPSGANMMVYTFRAYYEGFPISSNTESTVYGWDNIDQWGLSFSGEFLDQPNTQIFSLTGGNSGSPDISNGYHGTEFAPQPPGHGGITPDFFGMRRTAAFSANPLSAAKINERSKQTYEYTTLYTKSIVPTVSASRLISYQGSSYGYIPVGSKDGDVWIWGQPSGNFQYDQYSSLPNNTTQKDLYTGIWAVRSAPGQSIKVDIGYNLEGLDADTAVQALTSTETCWLPAGSTSPDSMVVQETSNWRPDEDTIRFPEYALWKFCSGVSGRKLVVEWMRIDYYHYNELTDELTTLP